MRDARKIIAILAPIALFVWWAWSIWGCATVGEVERLHTELVAFKSEVNTTTEVGDIEISGGQVALALGVLLVGGSVPLGTYLSWRRRKCGRWGPSISKEERTNGE